MISLAVAQTLHHLLPLHTFAADCKPNFFGLPGWYEYMHMDSSCRVIFNSAPNGGAPTAADFFGAFVLIGLAIIDILLRIGGIVAVAFVIYGGIQYVTSEGESDRTAKARGTIINALIGMAICMISVALVAFVGKKVGG
jgi:hypothetical protein